MRWGVPPAVLIALLLATAPPAGAVQTFGSNLSSPVGTGLLLPDGGTYSNISLPPSNIASGGLTSPIDGVIVRWRVRTGGGTSGPHSPQVIRPGTSVTAISAITGEQVTPASSTVNVFPTRLPVRAGDGIGVRFQGGLSGRADTAGATSLLWEPPLQDGGPPAIAGAINDSELLVNADVEPDADGDGYGDETQDACPGDPALQEGPCDRTAPESTITNGPRDKTKKKKATFVFSATDGRAVASFQCSLDGGAFTACTSPFTVKVKKGRHTFAVRALDDTGNLEGTPATDAWKVKKKRKKKKK